VPTAIVIEIAPAEQARFRAELRRARRGRWLALPILLLWALPHSPREMAMVLLCARSTVYAVARDWQPGRRWPEPSPLSWPPRLPPSRPPRLLALLKKAPAAYAWCRTRWSGATLALPLETQGSFRLSAETVRRCLPALDWGWKRAKLAAQDSDPERSSKRARIPSVSEHVGRRAALLFADELALPLLPKVGAPWMPRATPVELLTPGQKEHRYGAGALALHTGQVPHCLWFRKMTGLFLDRWKVLDGAYPARHFHRIFMVADNSQIHQAAAVQRGLRQHPRLVLLFLPTDCPPAHPLERGCGDWHDKVTRHHRRKRRRDLVAEGEQHLPPKEPWHYQLSEIYHSVEVTKALQKEAPRFSSAAA
jgi:hypothetical protein